LPASYHSLDLIALRERDTLAEVARERLVARARASAPLEPTAATVAGCRAERSRPALARAHTALGALAAAPLRLLPD
jgi:hypothetical protein